MIKDFTKIKFAGGDCILITDRESQEAICVLKGYEVRQLFKEWEIK
jgi:hypothetical protein